MEVAYQVCDLQLDYYVPLFSKTISNPNIMCTVVFFAALVTIYFHYYEWTGALLIIYLVMDEVELIKTPYNYYNHREALTLSCKMSKY